MIDNKVYILSLYLRSLGIRIPMRIVQENLDTPIANTVRGISYALDCLHIQHDVYQIPKEYFDQIDSSFITTLNDDERYCMLKRINDGNFQISYSLFEKKSLTINEFLDKWSGLAIIATPSQNVYQHVLLSDILYILKENLLLITFFIMTIVCLTTASNYTNFIHSLVVYCGILFSYTLLKEEYGKGETRFCKIGKFVDCNAVLHSVKTISNIGLSDMAFGYFTYMAALCLFTNSFFSYFALLPIYLSLAFTIFSIWKQLNIKKICLYCMGVNICLWADGLLTFCNCNVFGEGKEWSDCRQAIISFCIALATWMLCKRKIINQQEILHLKTKESILYDEDTFKFLLQNSSKTEDINSNQATVIGNKEAAINIIAFTHPDCPNCKGITSEIQKLSNRAMIKWISLEHVDNNIRKFIKRYSITQTPTIIVNRHVLPKCYGVSDLKYII